MSFKKKVAYNTIAQTIGKVLTIFISMIAVMLLTRYLGPAGYGQYSIAIAFLGFFVVLADFGIYPIAVREMSQRPEAREKILGNVFAYRVVSAFLVFLLAFLVGLLMPYDNLVKLAIGIVAVQSFLGILNGSLISIFQINYRMDLTAIAEVIARAIYLALIFLAIKSGFNLLGILWFLVFSSLLNVILVYISSRRFIKLKPEFDPVFLKAFVKESFPMGIVSILGQFHYKIDTVILSLAKPAFDVGIYGATYRVLENLIFIPSIFTGLLYPKFSELFVLDKKSLKSFFQKGFDILLIAVFPVVIFFFLFAPQIIQVIGGREFAASVLPLRILVLGLFWVFLSTPFNHLIIAAKKQKWLILTWSGVVLLNIILNLILIPRFTYNGAAFATFTTELVGLILALVLANYLLKIKASFSLIKKLILPVIIGSIFFLVFFFLPPLQMSKFQNMHILFQLGWVLLTLILTFSFYGGLLLIFRVISWGLIKELFRKKEHEETISDNFDPR